MKKSICAFLVLCLCLGLCACGGDTTVQTQSGKSAEAEKADELILAIGEVSVDSEAAIMLAQGYYDTLTQEQKNQVEHYDVLVAAQELLPQKKLEAVHGEVQTLIEQGDYLGASAIVYEHPEFEDYEELVQQCAKKVVPQYVMEHGEEKDTGKYFIKLTEVDGTIISLWYMEKTNALQFVYYTSGYGLEDGMMVDYYLDGDTMVFLRNTTNLSLPINSQNGTVTVSEYTGTYSGSIVDNSKECLVIPGLSIVSYTTAYDKQTRGYHTATMKYINEMLDAMYNAVAEEGYKGTLADMGFTAYKQEQPAEEVTAQAQVSTEAFEGLKAFILENGTKKEGIVNYSYAYTTQKFVVPVSFIYAEAENEIWVQTIHMQQTNVYYQIAIYISADENKISFQTQHASLDSSHESGIRIIKGTGTLDLQNMTALTAVAFENVEDNCEKGVPEGYEAAFGNRIHGMLSAMDEFLENYRLGTLEEFGFVQYIPPIQVGEMTFELT